VNAAFSIKFNASFVLIG